MPYIVFAAIEGYLDERAETESWHRAIYTVLHYANGGKEADFKWKIERLDLTDNAPVVNDEVEDLIFKQFGYKIVK